MKSLKKLLICLLTLMLFAGMMTMPAFAASISQDGIEVTLTTNKEDYSQGEEIVATLRVINTSDRAVRNVSMENLVPNGYKLAEGSEATKQVESLEADETISLEVTYVAENIGSNQGNPDVGDNTGDGNNSGSAIGDNDDSGNDSGSAIEVNAGSDINQDPASSKNLASAPGENNNSGNKNAKKDASNSPETGDTTNIMLWASLIVLASLGIILLLARRKKKGKKLLSLFLAIIMVGAIAVSAPAKVNAAEGDKTISVSKTINIENRELELKSVVSYQSINEDNEESPDHTYTRAEWIHKLVEVYGYPEIGEVSQPYYSDIADSEYKEDIDIAAAYSIIVSNGEEFNPDAPATREFAAVTAIRSMGYQADTDLQCDDFVDLTYPKEASLAIEVGLLELEEGSFYPTRLLNIGEATNILDIVLKTYNTTNGDDDYEGFVFRDGVIVLEETVEYSDDGGILHLPVLDELENLKVDDIIVIGNSYAYKVVSFSIEEDNIVIHYTTPELQEFLESMDIGGEAYMDFSQFVPAEGVTVTNNSAANQIQSFSFMDDGLDVPNASIDLGVDLVLEGAIDLGDDWSLDYSLQTSIPSISYKFDIDFSGTGILNPDVPAVNVKNAYVKMKQGTTLSAGFGKDFDGNDHGDMIMDDIVYQYIPLGRVPAVGADGMGMVVEIDLVMNAQGTFEIQFNVAGTIGC